MSELENKNDQDEVEINLFAEEEFNEGKEVELSKEEITIDFGEAADSLLEDIKSDSTYTLEPNPVSDDDFDPGDVSTQAVVNVDDLAAEEDHGPLTDSTDLDEPQESINLVTEEEVVFHEPTEEEEEQKALKSRSRLRRLLVFFIIVLLVLAGGTGLVIWRNSTPPDVKKPDSDALQTSAAGTNTTQFQAVDADNIPDLIAYFGQTPEQAVEASGGAITLDGASTPSTDASLPNVASTRNGWYVGENGQTLANLTFGLNAEGVITYIFTSFDLDAYGVADAKFDELASSNVIAASFMKGIGLDDATVDAAQLTIIDNPDAVTARDASAQEIAQFTGPTNIEGAPTQWKLVESYDHTAGVTIGDNSVIRTLSIDLR